MIPQVNNNAYVDSIKNNLIKVNKQQQNIKALNGDVFVADVLDFVLKQEQHARKQHLISVKQIRTLDLLRDVFTRMGIKCLAVQGETSNGVLHDSIFAFENGLIQILIGTHGSHLHQGWVTRRADVCVSATYPMFESDAIQFIARVRPEGYQPYTDVELNVPSRIYTKGWNNDF